MRRFFEACAARLKRPAAGALLVPLCLLPKIAGANFTAAEDRVLSARAAGSGGAWEAGPRSADAALMNPAGLPTRAGSDLLLSGGSPGRRGSALGAAVLTLPVDEALSLAVSYHTLVQESAVGYVESTAALSAAFELTRFLSLGGRYNWQQLRGEKGASGGSLDFGARARLALGARQGFVLALGARNAASFWGERQWARAVPVTVKGGLGWTLDRSSWLGLEFSRILPSTPALEPQSLLRGGGEHRFDSGIFFNAGLSSDAEQRYSLGTGWEGRGLGPRAHYALMASESGGLGHRLQLEWAFGAAAQPTVSVAPLSIRYEEGTKRVKEAKLAINVAEDQKAEAWQLEIRDKDGRLIRVIEGSGTPPGFVSWDGKDQSGAWVDDGGQVSYRLKIKTPDGEAASRPLLAGDLSLSGESMSALSIASDQSALPAMLPVFGADGKEVDHFLIKMPSAASPSSKWTVLIKDSQGKLLQAIEGSGPLPAELSWDGLSKEGMRIQDASSVRISLLSTDMNGVATETLGTVYSQAGLALDWGEDAPTRLILRVAPLSPGGQGFAMTLSDITLEPMAADTHPAEPMVAALAASAPAPSSTPIPQALRADMVQGRVLSKEAHIRIRSALGRDRMAFAFLPPPSAAPEKGPSRPLDPALLRRLRLASLPVVLDIFAPESPYEEAGFEGKLDAAWKRYQGLGFKRLRLTGLVQNGELGGASLSRARAVRVSGLLSGKGFKGEFVIWVQAKKAGKKGCALKLSRNFPWMGLLGLGLMSACLAWLGGRRISAPELEPALRLGFARPAAALAKSPLFSAQPEGQGLFEPLERAFKIQLSAADRLRVDFPQEQELVLLECDVLPQARYGLAPRGQGWDIWVKPWQGAAWTAPSNSGGAVGPAAYPANGRIAYYDLGRIWISDLSGLRMQSLQHVPLLEQGGQLYWDYAGTRLCWMGGLSGAAAVDLKVDERMETQR